jgi:hypothetical protein
MGDALPLRHASRSRLGYRRAGISATEKLVVKLKK